jgi:hypothetical protein
MDSLWYFQNCLLASLPATRWRTALCQPMLVDGPMVMLLTLLTTRVLSLELRQVVDILVDDNVQVILLVVRRHVGGAKRLRHGG